MVRAAGTATAAQTVAAPAFTRTNPFTAEVLENFNLNGRGSEKETRHLKLAIEGSGLCFEPGDSLGIYPHNDPQLVDEVIGHMGWNAEEVIPAGKQELPLREALIQHYEITLLSKQLLKQAAAFSQDGLQDLVQADANEKLKAYTRGRDLLDLVRDFSIQGMPAPRVRAHAPQAARAAVFDRQQLPGELRRGRSADCRLALPGPQSRSPGNLLGPLRRAGRGGRLLAGLRALESRTSACRPIRTRRSSWSGPARAWPRSGPSWRTARRAAAGGKSWLFFGDRRFRTDFLYQVEWLRWLKLGVLTRLDVAFSRDQGAKVYVQHRMLEKSRELYGWLQEGAHFYVCGSVNPMAADVHATLVGIVAERRRQEQGRGRGLRGRPPRAGPLPARRVLEHLECGDLSPLSALDDACKRAVPRLMLE